MTLTDPWNNGEINECLKGFFETVDSNVGGRRRLRIVDAEMRVNEELQKLRTCSSFQLSNDEDLYSRSSYVIQLSSQMNTYQP